MSRAKRDAHKENERREALDFEKDYNEVYSDRDQEWQNNMDEMNRAENEFDCILDGKEY